MRLRRATAAGALLAGGLGALGGLAGCETTASQTSEHAPALLDVVGKPADQAGRILRAAGYRVAFVGEHGDPVSGSPDRLVVREDPAGGARVSAGRVVTLSLGSPG